MPANLTNNPIGAIFTEIASVDSTNNYAMQMVQNGLAKHGEVYFAHHQFAGKGQRNKHWKSSPGENIIISVTLNTSNLQVSEQFGLSMAMGLSLYDFFGCYTTGNVSIKWPNDLYWNDRKAGGILIENKMRGQEWQWAVVGVGVNINQTAFDDDIKNAVSLQQITGKKYSSVALAKELCFYMDKRYKQLLTGGIKTVLPLYNYALYKKDQCVRLRENNIVFDCVIKGVNRFGQLIVEHGTEKYFNVGEVEWPFI